MNLDPVIFFYPKTETNAKARSVIKEPYINDKILVNNNFNSIINKIKNIKNKYETETIKHIKFRVNKRIRLT